MWLDLTTPEDAVPTQEQAGSRGSQHVVDLRALLVDDSLPCLLKPTASNQPGDSHRSDAVLAAMQHEYAARSVKRQRLDGPVDIARFPLDGGAAVASGMGGGAGGGAGAGAGSFWDAVNEGGGGSPALVLGFVGHTKRDALHCVLYHNRVTQMTSSHNNGVAPQLLPKLLLQRQLQLQQWRVQQLHLVLSRA